MREILYKARRVDNGEWVEGNFWKDGTGRCFIVLAEFEHEISPVYQMVNHKVSKDTVCQFVNGLDRNKNKVFDGDILRYHDCDVYETVCWVNFKWCIQRRRRHAISSLPEVINRKTLGALKLTGRNIHDEEAE